MPMGNRAGLICGPTHSQTGRCLSILFLEGYLDRTTGRFPDLRFIAVPRLPTSRPHSGPCDRLSAYSGGTVPDLHRASLLTLAQKTRAPVASPYSICQFKQSLRRIKVKVHDSRKLRLLLV